VVNVEDQFDRVLGVAPGQIRYLHGVIVLPGPDQHQGDDRRGAAGSHRDRRPAGHRVVVDPWDEARHQRPHGFAHLAVVLAVTIVISVTLSRWAKRQGRW
jgi:hypothetical protein